jgi:hypothetical protein
MEALLRSELAELKTSALQKRARAMRVDQDALDDVVDSDDPRRALIDLIVAAARAADAAASSASAPSGAPAPTPSQELEPEPEVRQSFVAEKPAAAAAAAAPAPAPAPATGGRRTGLEAVALPASMALRNGIAIETQGRRVPGHLNDTYMLLRAAESGDLETVRAKACAPGVRVDGSLPSYLLSPAIHRLTALHFAAHNGFVGVVEALIELRADVEARSSGAHMDTIHWTTLHHAVAGGNADCTAVLIAAGADRSAKTLGGDTPETLRFKRWPENVQLRDALDGNYQPRPTEDESSAAAAVAEPARPVLEYSSFSVGVQPAQPRADSRLAKSSGGGSDGGSGQGLRDRTTAATTSELRVDAPSQVAAGSVGGTPARARDLLSDTSLEMTGPRGTERAETAAAAAAAAAAESMGAPVSVVGGRDLLAQRREGQEATRQERLLLAASASLPAGW